MPYQDYRHKCTAEDPWTPAKSERAYHPSAQRMGEQRDNYPGGDLQDWQCPVCGVTWTEELPQ